MVFTPQDIAHVEQRLKIVKRNRASAAARRTAGGAADGAQGSKRESPVPVQPTSIPPCSAYPTFNLARLPKMEQISVDALVADCLDVLLFSDCSGAAAAAK